MFNIFKQNKIEKKTWSNVTLKMFKEIQDLLEAPDDYTEANLRQLIYGVDTSDMPIAEASKYDISFLRNEVDKKNVKLKETYWLNGKKYRSNINLTKVSTAQFIDFTNYAKEESTDFNKLLSVFVIPDGHNYNDGYNMKEVQEDLLQLDIATVYSLSFFMTKQLQLFAIIFQASLVEEMEKMNLSLTEKKQLEKSLKEAMTSVSSLL